MKNMLNGRRTNMKLNIEGTPEEVAELLDKIANDKFEKIYVLKNKKENDDGRMPKVWKK